MILKTQSEQLNKIIANATYDIFRNVVANITNYAPFSFNYTEPVLAYINKKTKHFVVKFKDNTEVSSTWEDSEYFDPYVAFAICIAKKQYGSNTKLRNALDEIFKQPKKTQPKEPDVDINAFISEQIPKQKPWRKVSREENNPYSPTKNKGIK